MGLFDRLFGGREAELVSVTAGLESRRPNVAVSPLRSTFDEWVTAIDGKYLPVMRRGGVKVALVDVAALAVLDLRELPSKRTRIVGSSNWVSDAGRAEFGGTEYLLVRQPWNPVDPSAVAVVGRGRVVGYLSSSKASAFAEVFDPIPVRYDAYRVTGASVFENSIRLWVDVPYLPALRSRANKIRDESER
jgi:hypothetical protein